MQVHTDLALEARESCSEGQEGIAGVHIDESVHGPSGVKVTWVEVLDKQGEEAIGKPCGSYITLEAEQMAVHDEGCHREISRALAEYIKKLLGGVGSPRSVLVVGLGNQEVTSDSLGPQVLGNLRITRHLSLEANTSEEKKQEKRDGGLYFISGMVPGVMAQTGMETAEMIRGIVAETKPEALIVVDALAARSVSRLGTTIQLSNTGISPGSGVGNHRHSLTEESLGVPVIAIGVPTVVAAAAIVYDTVDALAELLEAAGSGNVAEAVDGMSLPERYQMVRELIEPRLGPMYVTPGNIDERIKLLSFIISEGINQVFV
ncbi:MAG: GPR endopeptidase [Lachnospiraceae bacterium]|nr:GPR endopeptidase [Lachnospiraceae bacterium]